MAGEDRYRLAAVRDVRARDEQARKGDLAVAVGDARQTQGRLDAARERTAAARAALLTAQQARDALLSAGSAGSALVRAEAYIARRRRELEAATGEEVRCEAVHAGRIDEIDAARGTLTRARAERQVIERHFERWREDRKKLAERRED
ncbi:MAG TPA: hypothetical protein VLB44_04865 [Kofleriaceae bacterium]|nr:hypothetical protein [Kofleriaceae bacterium]